MSLESMIDSAVNRDGKGGSSSTIVALDLRQKCEFAVRGGSIEFFPLQDDEQDTRKKAMAKWFKDNRLSQRLEHCMALYLTRGEILWLLLPDGRGGYLVDFFHGGDTDPSPEYKVFYKSGGRQIQSVVITYPYKTIATVDSFNLGGMPNGTEVERWVKLVVTENWIEETDLPNKPAINMSYSQQGHLMDAGGVPGATRRYANPFAPTLPVVVSPNNPRRSGQPGTSDYHWMRQQIEEHEKMVGHIKHNLKFFGNPTLVTTRSPSEVKEAADRGLQNPGWASSQGFVDGYGDAFSSSTRVQDPLSRQNPGGDNDERIAKVIGGVAEGERFGYIVPDPVTGDLNNFQKQERELIHYALGGIDPLGVSSGATAFEIKTLFGRVENTADGKADGLYTHGLALVFEMMLYLEEQTFKKDLFYLMKETGDPRFDPLQDWSQINDEAAQFCVQMIQEGKLILSSFPQGMIPLGERTVSWRYTRPVFKNSTREMLDLSISSRNAREDGMSQEYCLRMQHPDMTDKEIKETLSGFSPRVVNSASQAIGTLLQLYTQLSQIPDPLNPTLPWALSLGIQDMIQESLLTLKNELAYGKQNYDPSQPSPAINEPSPELFVPRGADVSATSNAAAFTSYSGFDDPRLREPSTASASTIAYGLPADIQPTPIIGGGFGESGRLPQATGIPAIPSPGSTVATSRGSVQPTGYSQANSAITGGILPAVPPEYEQYAAVRDIYPVYDTAQPILPSTSDRPTSRRHAARSRASKRTKH